MPSALIGGALSIGSSLLGKKSSDKAAKRAAAAAEFKPYNISGDGSALGSLTWDKATNSVSVQGDESLLNLQKGMTDMGAAAIANDPTAQFYGMNQAIGGQLPGLFNQYGQAADTALAEQQGGYNAFLQNAGAGQAFLNQNLGLAGQQIGQPGMTDVLGNQQIAYGQGLQGQSVQGLIDNTYANLSAQAKPAEERAVNSKLQSLFSRGTLGATSGARAIGELAQAQNQADLQRQMAAQQVGMNQWAQNQNVAANAMGFGAGQLYQGSNQNMNLANAYMGLGTQGANSLLGMGAGIMQGASNYGNNIMNNFGQRMAQAQGLFGFGQGAQANQMNFLNSAAQGAMNVNTDLRNLIALGGNIGGTQAAAGANAANYINKTGSNPFAAAVGGIGTGMMENGGWDAVNNFFGGSK